MLSSMKGKKKAVMLLCFLLLFAAMSSIAGASNEQKIEVYSYDFDFTVDGQTYRAPSETQSFIYQNRTYIPLRFASHILEKWVDWDSSARTVVVSEPSQVQLKQLQALKKNYVAQTNGTNPTSKKTTMLANLNYGQFNFYGKLLSVPNDSTTILHNGTIYVPVRFFAESINKQVDYDAATKSIVMKTKSQATQEEASKDADNSTGKDGSSSQPSRDSLVNQTASALEKLESSAMSKFYSLFDQYRKTTDEAKRTELIDQGQALIAETDTKVEELLAALDEKLSSNGYDVGSDSQSFRDTYTQKKDTLYAKLLN